MIVRSCGVNLCLPLTACLTTSYRLPYFGSIDSNQLLVVFLPLERNPAFEPRAAVVRPRPAALTLRRVAVVPARFVVAVFLAAMISSPILNFYHFLYIVYKFSFGCVYKISPIRRAK